MRRTSSVALILSSTVLLAGCTSAPDPELAAGHSHAGGTGIVSLAVGDGTSSSEVGYTLSAVKVVEHPDELSTLHFRIDSYDDAVLTDYVEEQTKDLHLYVVNDDLTVFRHLHPTMTDDGTWSAPFDVPDAGGYRVITEFVAKDEGGNGDHLVLGHRLDLPAGDPGDTSALDEVVNVSVAQAPRAGANGLLRLVIRDARQQPVRLGTYLGAYGHVTGFNRETDAVIHLHPLGAPQVTEDGSELRFHAEINTPGDYRLFVQVRVDGFLHTMPVDITVAPSA